MRQLALALFVVILACACTATPAVDDYAAFYEHQPRTILVLPVRNETTSAEAPGAFQSTIASPLIQRGYYIFPVLPTLDVMRAEGIFEGEELVGTPPARFKELLGADAVLYITLHTWDTSYAVLASGVTVAMTYQLVDTSTGATLWKDDAKRTIQSQASGSLLAMAINAAITAMSTQYVYLAREANIAALASLPAGQMNRNFETERTRYLDVAARAAARKANKQSDPDNE